MVVGAVVVVVIGAVGMVVGAVVVGTVVVVGADVTVMVDGSAGTVAVLGSAVTVGVSVGSMVTVTVDTEVEVTVPGSGTPTVAWIERLTVAEKLALTDASVEVPAGASGVMAVVESVVVAAPVPGSVESTVGWAIPGSVAVSGPAMSPGRETSLGASDVELGFVTLVRLRTARWSKASMVHSPESFARSGGLESARTKIVIPIAAVTDAATTPARDICRRNRAADGPAACLPPHRRIRVRGGSALMSGSAARSSLLSSVCIQLLLSPSNRADRWEPVTPLRTARPVISVNTPPSTTRKNPEYRIPNFSGSARTSKRGHHGVASPNSSREASMIQGFTEKNSAQTLRIRTSTAKYGPLISQRLGFLSTCVSLRDRGFQGFE